MELGLQLLSEFECSTCRARLSFKESGSTPKFAFLAACEHQPSLFSHPLPWLQYTPLPAPPKLRALSLAFSLMYELPDDLTCLVGLTELSLALNGDIIQDELEVRWGHYCHHSCAAHVRFNQAQLPGLSNGSAGLVAQSLLAAAAMPKLSYMVHHVAAALPAVQALSHLSHLEHLTVGLKNASGPEAAFLGRLPHLIYLDLSDGNPGYLTADPGWLGQLTTLKTSWHQFANPPEQILAACPNLRVLHMWSGWQRNFQPPTGAELAALLRALCTLPMLSEVAIPLGYHRPPGKADAEAALAELRAAKPALVILDEPSWLYETEPDAGSSADEEQLQHQ